MAHSTGVMGFYVPASPDYSEHEFDIDAEIEVGIEVEAEESQQPPADFDEQDGPAAAAALSRGAQARKFGVVNTSASPQGSPQPA